MKPEPVFRTEADLCRAWIDWATREGYRCYPETADFDILAVDPDGWQIGVEAKLRMNVKVLSQALPRYNADTGPDHRAVLVPSMDGELRELCGFVGVEIFYHITDYGGRGRHEFDRDTRWRREAMFDWNPKQRCKLPDYMPDVPAGVPSPVKLTPWKVAALKVLARLEISGWITRKEISIFGIDPRRWTGGDGWLVPLDGDPKRGGRWAPGPRYPKFAQQHPEVYAQIKAELIKGGDPMQQRVLEVGT